MNPDLHLLYVYILKYQWRAEITVEANNRYIIKVFIAYLSEMEDYSPEDHFLVTLEP